MLGLLWYLQRRLARRGKQRRDGDGIVVIARQPLGSKSQLVIVEADDRRYVLGVGEHGISVIDSLPAGHVSRPVRHLASERAEAQSAPSREVTVSAASAFERVLAAETAASAPPTLRRHRRADPPDPLRGSILSPQTWRRTAEFLRRPR